MLSKTLALAAIRLYQRWLSPLKGFRCAYRVHTGRRSCSHFGLRAIGLYGLAGGYALLRGRTALCADCHGEHRRLAARRRAELGSCDLPCDLPCMPDACDICDVLDCDWDRKRNDSRPTRQQRQEARRRRREQRRFGTD